MFLLSRLTNVFRLLLGIGVGERRFEVVNRALISRLAPKRCLVLRQRLPLLL